MLDSAEKYRLEGDEEMSFCRYQHYFKIASTLHRPDFVQTGLLVEELLKTNEKLSLNERLDDVFRNLRDSLAVRYDRESFDLISCLELRREMKTPRELLILDCRPREDYEKSRIKFERIVNFPQATLEAGEEATRMLLSKFRQFWRLRENSKLFVFVDTAQQGTSPGVALKRTFLDSMSADLRQEIVLLKGGYEEWKMTYPDLCTPASSS